MDTGFHDHSDDRSKRTEGFYCGVDLLRPGRQQLCGFDIRGRNIPAQKEQMDHVVREVSGRVAVNAEVTAKPLFHEVFAAPCPLETVKPVPILKSGNGSGKSTAFTALTVRAAPFEFGNGVRFAVAAGADEFGRTDFIGFL